MYSNKENVNILTAMLVEYGISNVVVCPGSRNAPLVHNFNECPTITCWPVTDERSAGFYALGMCQATDKPVAVCVTSGTALLNLLPSVAEAWYQHLPLVVVSADRPTAWIDQQDGQTLPQPDALGRFVRKAVSLPEVNDDESRWYAERLTKEALEECNRNGYCFPVHINVPISEPLFSFTTISLPKVSRLRRITKCYDAQAIRDYLIPTLLTAKRPMVIIGQSQHDDYLEEDVEAVGKQVVVLHERLCGLSDSCHFEEVLSSISEDSRLKPDWVLYLGGTLVSKRLKKFIRTSKAQVWNVCADGTFYDTFMNTVGIIESDLITVFHELAGAISLMPLLQSDFYHLWQSSLALAEQHSHDYHPTFSEMAAVKCFEGMRPNADVHYANSSAIRLANIYAREPVFCNRGVNGIEGSLSTAAGFSCVTSHMVCCVIGDLSFFYDANALWNQNLNGNLRILLLNNSRGGIFNMLNGLEQSPARDEMVAARHFTSAEGLCKANHVEYRCARSMEQLTEEMPQLLRSEAKRPVLLEVFTDAEEDTRNMKDYFATLGKVR